MISDKDTEKEKESKDSISPYVSTPTFTTQGIGPAQSLFSTSIAPASQPVFIGIAGATASGKSTISAQIIERLNKNNILTDITNVALIPLDSFYRNLTAQESEEAAKRNFDFDCENAFDFVFLHDTLRRIKKGEAVKIFEYDFVFNRRKEDTFTIVEKPDVVILEGILTLHDPHVRKLLNIKLFVECDLDVSLGRRITRDIKSRGRKLEDVLDQYFKFVKPGYDAAILPSKKYADLSVNTNTGKSPVAVELVCAWIKDIIVSRHGLPHSPSPSPSASLSPSPSSTGPVTISNE